MRVFLVGLCVAECEDIVVLVEVLDEFGDGVRAFGFQVLALLHVPHLLVELGDEGDELLFVSAFVLVELDDPLLEDVEERLEAVVVGLLLEASGEPRVYRHLYLNMQ